MALHSSKTTLENVLLAIDFILELLEMGKERFKDGRVYVILYQFSLGETR